MKRPVRVISNSERVALWINHQPLERKTHCSPLSGYEGKQRLFEENSLPSGRFGPVKIRFGKSRFE